MKCGGSGRHGAHGIRPKHWVTGLSADVYKRQEERDSAIYYINKKIEDSTNIKGRATALLNLSYIKEEQGDYPATTELLYQFVDIIDSIYLTEQSNKRQQLIHKYDSQTKVKEEQFKGQKKLRTAIEMCIRDRYNFYNFTYL